MTDKHLMKWHFDRAGVKGITPGDEVHQTLMTASKISATFIPSRSPYESYYSQFLKMSGVIAPLPPNQEVLDRGHLLEPAVADWFQSQHPELNIRDPRGKVWFYDQLKGYGATPDRYLEQGGQVLALLEIKTSTNPDGWGEPGTEEIPPHYYDQVQWQMLCTGVPVAYVARLSSGLRFTEYRVEANRQWQEKLLATADDFMEAIRTGQQPSVTDPAHTATYEAVRVLHPEIDGTEVELPAELVREYLEANEADKEAKKRLQGAKSLVMEAMGMAKTGTVDGTKFVTRQARGEDKAPFVQVARGRKSTDLPQETNQTSAPMVRNDLRKAA